MPTWMFGVYYLHPANTGHEAMLKANVVEFGGRLDYREENVNCLRNNVYLTFEFDTLEQAQSAADELREHAYVEGLYPYAD
jgi:hypothetical protein